MEQSGDSVTLCLEANVLTMEKFPFAFKLFSTFRLEGVTVHHDIRVENDGGEVMPFAFGYHPAFLCPFDAAHKAEDYVLRFDTPQTPTVIETGEDDGLVTGATRVYFESETDIPLHDGMFDHDSTCFSRLTAGSLSIVEKETGRRVSVGIEGYPYVLIWSAKGPVRYVCIEPWHGLPGRAHGQRHLGGKARHGAPCAWRKLEHRPCDDVRTVRRAFIGSTRHGRAEGGLFMLTRDSRIGEIYATPIGHDIIHTLLLQTGLPEKAVANPVVRRLSLRALQKLAPGQAGRQPGGFPAGPAEP